MSILVPDIAITEKVLRSVGVYLFLLIVFVWRASAGWGSSRPSTWSCCWSSATCSRTRPSESTPPWAAGSSAPPVIIVLNWMVAWLTFRHKRLERMVENVPTVLVKHGQALHANLDREHMSMPELRAALRKEGNTTMTEVRYAILEEDGHVSVIPRRSVPA